MKTFTISVLMYFLTSCASAPFIAKEAVELAEDAVVVTEALEGGVTKIQTIEQEKALLPPPDIKIDPIHSGDNHGQVDQKG